MFLTPTHLGIAMDYAAGGELFKRVVAARRFEEDVAVGAEGCSLVVQLCANMPDCDCHVVSLLAWQPEPQKKG